MYKGVPFRIRLLKDILEDLDLALDRYGPRVRTLFLPDGNTIVMKTSSLVPILEHARRNFPGLERVTVYGSARFINRKDAAELKDLAEAGLGRVHMGLESGDDPTLALMKKGATAAESIAAGQKIRAAGLELSAYYLVGLGGRTRFREHARASARALNEMAPEFIRLRTYYPTEGAPLFEDMSAGRFEIPGPYEALEELRLLVSGLRAETMVLSDHISNYLNISGRIPRDREDMLAEIDAAMNMEAERFERTLYHL